MLVRNVSSAAHALKFPQPPEINDIAATDTRVFAKSDVLAINFHSLGYTTIPAVFGIDARVAHNDLDPAVYSDTYNLLCVYVLLVDKAIDLPRSASPPQASDNPEPARATRSKAVRNNPHSPVVPTKSLTQGKGGP